MQGGTGINEYDEQEIVMQGGTGINEQDDEFDNFKSKGLTQNPLGHVGMFATPEHMKELETYLQQFNGAERTVAWTCAMMAWNLAHKIVEGKLNE